MTLVMTILFGSTAFCQDTIIENVDTLKYCDTLQCLDTLDCCDTIGNTDSDNDMYITNEDLRRREKNMFIGLVMLILVVMVLYYVMRSQIDNLNEELDKLQTNYNKLDERLLDIMHFQPLATDEDDSHSFALKVADEVVRIEMNLSKMDKNIKGYKQLAKAVERIKDNFMAQGYEIVDLLGKDYDEGMRVNADFVSDDSLPEGSRVIAAVTKPQINYKGKIIQKAIVTVSQNV